MSVTLGAAQAGARLGAYTAVDRYQLARYGRILRVDYENWVVDITWDQFNGAAQEAPLSMAFVTPRAVLGGMPEVGTAILSDFTASNKYKSNAVVSAYIPAGFKAGIHQELQTDQRLIVPGFSERVIRRKFRKLWPGEIIGSSSQGSDWLLDEHVYIQGSKGDEIRIDARDQSINSISIQKKSITDASRSYDGWVYRHIAETYDEAGKVTEVQYEPDTYQKYIIDESFKKRWYRTVAGDKTVDDYYLDEANTSAPLVEVRREIREIGYGHLPLVDENVEEDQWLQNNTVGSFKRGNIIESSMGTLVGYTPDTLNYGNVLRAQIFDNPDSANPTILEYSITEGQAPDYTPVRYQAVAAMWKMPQSYSQTRMYVSKEGQTFIHIGATWEKEDCPFEPKTEYDYSNRDYASFTGAGRALDIHLAGSLKAVIDKNRLREESIDLKTIGKVYFHFGKDDGIPSIDRRSYLVEGKSYKGGVVRPLLSQVEGDGAPVPTAKEWSIEGITDGGISLRVGRTHGRNLRQFERNGFTSEGDSKTDKFDVRDVERTNYPIGDEFYRHHDLRLAGLGAPGRIGTAENDTRSAHALSNPNKMGSSLDAHLVGNAFLRVGSNSDKVSLALDAQGGLVGFLGAENKDNRSITLSLDGGIEAAIGRMTTSGNSIQAILEGGINLKVKGSTTSQTNYYEFEGDQKIKYSGKHEVEIKGTLQHDISVDHRESVGGMKTVTVMRNYLTSVSGTRVTQIANVPPNTVADKVSILSGNRELKIETKGDIKYETKMGQLIMQTLQGNAEFKSMLGSILVEALMGNIDIHSPNVGCGIPGPKFKLLHQWTPCIAMGIPHGLPIMGIPGALTDHLTAN